MNLVAKIVARLLVARAVLASFRSKPVSSTRSRTPASTVAPTTSEDATRSSAMETDERSVAEPIPPQKAEGPGPESPLDLPPPDWWQTAKRTLKEIKDDRIPLTAAGMAYYWFLAIFPALIAMVGILGLVNVGPAVVENINQSIENTLPQGASTILTNAISRAENASQGASLVAAIAGIAIALWSATSGMVALQSGLNIAYDVPRDRTFIKKRLIGLMLIVAMGLLGGVPSPFFTFGDTTVFKVVGWVLTIAALIVLFAIFYYKGPNRESPLWKWVTPGGVVGAALWAIASLAFSFYVNLSTSYEKTYGAFAGVVILILWLYLSAVSILVGGELNAELERQSELRKRA